MADPIFIPPIEDGVFSINVLNEGESKVHEGNYAALTDLELRHVASFDQQRAHARSLEVSSQIFSVLTPGSRFRAQVAGFGAGVRTPHRPGAATAHPHTATRDHSPFSIRRGTALRGSRLAQHTSHGES